jgi:hypothetical protein
MLVRDDFIRDRTSIDTDLDRREINLLSLVNFPLIWLGLSSSKTDDFRVNDDVQTLVPDRDTENVFESVQA